MFKAIRTKLYYTRIRQFIKYKGYQNDKKYIAAQYFSRFGRKLDLENPIGFNEKNNWRKLYERNPLYTQMVDKYAIKSIVEERLGAEYTFPLLRVWDNADEINFNQLPDQFVLKPNHAGGVIICRDKDSFDIAKAKQELKNMLKIDYFLPNREWPYKNVKRRIVAETYMGENLTDYKSYCFNGQLTYTLTWKNKAREDGRKPEATFFGAYDRDWKRTDLKIGYPSSNEIVEKPECYDELIHVCESMSKGIPFVRVDCYIIDNKVYVGEMTFFPWSGYQKFVDETWNIKLGNLFKLRNPI